MNIVPRRVIGLVAAAAVILSAGFARAVTPADDFGPTPGVACTGPNDAPETIQGRTPLADYDSGRAGQGYRCNASELAHLWVAGEGSTGGNGGYRVWRYDDGEHQCAFFDTTLLFPANAKANADPNGGSGLWVVDMTDPAHPIHTDTLRTPAFQSPHESVSLNEARGLLGAVFANPLFYHGQFDLFDVSQDCRHPVLRSTLPMGTLGHEGSFSPDGNTYWSASLYGHTLTAIDTTDPTLTAPVFTTTKYNVHGMNMSDDGNIMYFADIGQGRAPQPPGDPLASKSKGLTILDVSEIQSRAANPQIRELSHLTWAHVGTPQTALPVTFNGVHHVVEVDEFGSGDNVGAARIINVEDPAHPFVVSNMRLAVNNLDHQSDGSQSKDPAASNSLGGYAGHYCSVPTKVDPTLVACSFILSGLRVFDISDIEHPVELAYFNKPSTVDAVGLTGYGKQGSYAMSQPAFDVARHQIWYSDGNSGFFVVQIEADPVGGWEE